MVSRSEARAKRIFDLAVAIPLAIVSIPFFLIGAFLVAIGSGPPIFFWSERVGRDGKLFNMVKFRTMKTGAPLRCTWQIENPDQYITPIGSFMRKISLDELPQLYHALKGEMSLVGPRPLIPADEATLRARAELNITRLYPGITGLAQISGRDDLSNEEKVAKDLEYMMTRSIRLDTMILLKTVAYVIKGKGVSH